MLADGCLCFMAVTGHPSTSSRYPMQSRNTVAGDPHPQVSDDRKRGLSNEKGAR
jgi:hypothetical protein